MASRIPVPVARATPNLDEESRQIGSQLAGVRWSQNGIDVDTQFWTVGDPEGEGLEDSKGAAHCVPDATLGVHGQEDTPQGRRDRRSEVPVLIHLDVLVEVSPSLGQLFELVE